MGVKGLWTILGPIAEKQPLWELKDQTVAIDLSGWICENQNIDNFNGNLHVRNLFFRTSYMLLVGIKPIFILEGKAPTLKYDEIERRKVHTNNSTVPNVNAGAKKRGVRSRLNCAQKQCEELLKYIGVPYYYSEGEAEALCALLNEKGLVDGVISQDSDCFLYGAKSVYRNFTIGSCGGSVEKFTMSSIEKKLSLGRRKLIALSLLCGCDYNDRGILGIGNESALKYLSMCTDSEILARLSSWRENSSQIIDECRAAATPQSKLEASLIRKALQNPSFPFLDVQNEFLGNQLRQNVDIIYEWKKPNIKNVVMMAERYFGWNASYSLEKCLPLLSRWHLLYDADADCIQLERIVRKRNLRNVPSYEVKWKDFDSTTVEPFSILKSKYEKLVQNYEQDKKLLCKKKKSRKNDHPQNDDVTDDIIDGLSRLNVVASAPAPASASTSASADDSLTVSDFECSARDLLELSSIVESIANNNGYGKGCENGEIASTFA